MSDQKQVVRHEDGSVSWIGVCPRCHKKFETTSRRQKFCSNDCAVKYAKKQKEQKERYSHVKEVERIRVRAHSLALAVFEELCNAGIREHKCECCGSEEGPFELHHVDTNWLCNTPSNLKYLCKKCHAKVHSDLEKELNEKGILLAEYYNPSMGYFMKKLNKNSQ